MGRNYGASLRGPDGIIEARSEVCLRLGVVSLHGVSVRAQIDHQRARETLSEIGLATVDEGMGERGRGSDQREGVSRWDDLGESPSTVELRLRVSMCAINKTPGTVLRRDRCFLRSVASVLGDIGDPCTMMTTGGRNDEGGRSESGASQIQAAWQPAGDLPSSYITPAKPSSEACPSLLFSRHFPSDSPCWLSIPSVAWVIPPSVLKYMHRYHSWAKAHASSARTPTTQSIPPASQSSADTPDNPSTSSEDAEKVNPGPEVVAGPVSEPQTQEKPNTTPGLLVRAKHGTVRFVRHTKDALCHSWVNILLVFVPVGIAAEAAGLAPAVIFAMNAVAIIPLAGLLSHATECVASRLGDNLGALINVTFGNAVELIIFIIALVKNEIRIVQASLLGSILANLLLILGMAFLLGGLRFQEQIYNSTVTQMSACLLSLSVMSLLLPTAFHASWSDSAVADKYTLKVSRGTSVVLLLVYILYLLFQLKSHSYLYASIPQQIIDEESHPGVLAELMNHSSDSSSSSDESVDTTTSWTTAKRIKRAMKYRRRRKSSGSSRRTSSPEAFRKHTLSDMAPVGTNDNSTSAVGSVSSHIDDPISYAIDFGDDHRYEADNDGNHHEPQPRDFGGPSQQDISAPRHVSKKEKKKMRREAKHQRKLAQQQALGAVVDTVIGRYDDSNRAAPSAEPGHVQDSGDTSDLPKRRSPFRPTMPSLLSNNVFSNNAGPGNPTPMPSSGNIRGLRRTNSLPSQMNRSLPVGNAVQFARGASRMPSATNVKAIEVSSEHQEPMMSRTSAVVMLLMSTALVAVCAEFLVDAIPAMLESSSVSEAFIGLIVLPIVGNAAEHVTAVSVATKNKMDLSIGVSVGSSIQIAIFVTPLVVILGWCMDKEMSLYFTLFETVCLFVTAFVVNFLVLDGRSNYLEGALLIAAYVIIGVAAFFYPGTNESSGFDGTST